MTRAGAGRHAKRVPDRVRSCACRPSLPGQLVPALKILGGFSTRETALPLMTTEQNVRKQPPGWLARCYLWDATRGALERRAGRFDDATRHLRSALGLAPHPAERSLIAQRLSAGERGDAGPCPAVVSPR